MYSRTFLIGRIGHNAEAKTDKNQQEYVVLSITTKDGWKDDQGDYESRTKWHRVYACARAKARGEFLTRACWPG